MKYEIAMKWVEALRSGNYKQGTGYLKNNDKFCCLGVLCDISQLGEWDGNYYENKLSTLPNKVREWAGMNSDLGENYELKNTLSNYNDTGYSFEKIADII